MVPLIRLRNLATVLCVLAATTWNSGLQAEKAQPQKGTPKVKVQTHGSTDAATQKSTAKKPVAQPTIPKRAQDNGVRDQFSRGLQLSQAGKTDDAMLAFEQLLRTYPGHQPSLIQYGKLLYSRDRIPEAYNAFSRVNPIGLDVETSYEYALSHFWMRQYEQALFGFKRVPEGSSLFDLANYYGAISALKLRRLIEAETMMERAVVLPDQLAKSRQNYLKHINDMKLLQEKQGLAEERDREKKRLDEAVKKEDGLKPTPQQMRDASKYHHRGFEAVELSPIVGIKFKQQVNDNHGYAEEIATVRDTYFELKGGVMLPLPIKFRRDQAAIGLLVSGKIEEEQRKGQQKRNVQSDDLDDIERIMNADPNRIITKYGSYTLGAWFETPTPARIWLSLGGSYYQKYLDFEESKRTGTYEGYFQLGSKERGKEYRAKYQYGEVANNDNRRTQTVHTINFIWRFPVTMAFVVDAEVLHKIFQYDDETLDGPSSASSFSPDLNYAIPYGFTLGLKPSVLYQSDYLYHNVPTYEQVSADGMTYGAKVYLRAEPVTWFTLTVSQQVLKTNWTVRPSEAQETFDQNHPDYQEEFEATAALNLFF